MTYKNMKNSLDEKLEKTFNMQATLLAIEELAMDRALAKEEEFYYRVEAKKVREQISEFVFEIDSKWRDDRRLEFLEGELRVALRDVDKFKKMKNNMGELFFYDKKLRNAENNYKRLYIEYASIYGQRDDDSSMSEEALQVCREVSIEDINPYQMKPGGRNRLLSQCPFHDDKTPSGWVFEGNSFHCFGCQANGQNAIDFIMKLNNLSFLEAVNYLKKY